MGHPTPVDPNTIRAGTLKIVIGALVAIGDGSTNIRFIVKNPPITRRTAIRATKTGVNVTRGCAMMMINSETEFLTQMKLSQGDVQNHHHGETQHGARRSYIGVITDL